MGHHIIMGRNTCESIGRPLPGRVSVVVSRNRAYVAHGAVVVNSLDEAIQLAAADPEAFVIGGGECIGRRYPWRTGYTSPNCRRSIPAMYSFRSCRTTNGASERVKFTPQRAISRPGAS